MQLAMAAGASFVGRETVLDPKKLERLFVKGFEHKGFSFFDIFSNCHINLGRKNKMGNAKDTLSWIDSRTMPKNKWDNLDESEKDKYFPLGVLKHDSEAMEYCDMYEKVKQAHQNNTKITANDLK